MQPSDWIALAALAVSALAVVVGPLIAARLERRARTETARRDLYARAARAVRQRRRPRAAVLLRRPGRLGGRRGCFGLCLQAGRSALDADLARNQGGDDVGARLRIGGPADRLALLVDQARNATHDDVGVGVLRSAKER